MKKQFNSPHGKDGCLGKYDILYFVGDCINLYGINSQLAKNFMFSQNVIDGFYKYFEIIKSRFPGKVTADFEMEEIKNILGNPEYSSEKDLLTYLNILIKLASKRAKDGKYIIPLKYVKILSDFKNLPNKLGSLQKKKQIEELIYAIEQGWLLTSAFDDFGDTSCILDCSEINPLILSDIRHMKAANGLSDQLDFFKGLNYFIPEYESEMEFRVNEKFKRLKPGSLVRFKNVVNSCNNGKVFVVDKDSYRPLRVDGETLLRALGPIGRFYIEQARSGTCYQLAGYISMMQEPCFYSRLLSRLEKNSDNLIVSLPSHCMKNNLLSGKTNEFRKINHVYELFVKLDDNGKFNSVDENQTVTAKPFYQSLEHLYGKYRKYDYADKFLKQFNLKGRDLGVAIDIAIKNIDKCIYKFEGGKWVRYTLEQINNLQKLEAEKEGKNPKLFKCVEDYYKESGSTFEIFDMIGGGNSYGNVLSGSNLTYSNLKKLLMDTQHGYGRVFGTKKSSKKSANGKTEIKILPEKGLYSSHAYSIYDYDPKTDIVKYINPWSSAFVFQIKLSELIKYISSVSTKKIV